MNKEVVEITDEQLLALHKMVEDNYTHEQIRVMLISALCVLNQDDFDNIIRQLQAHFDMFKSVDERYENGKKTS